MARDEGSRATGFAARPTRHRPLNYFPPIASPISMNPPGGSASSHPASETSGIATAIALLGKDWNPKGIHSTCARANCLALRPSLAAKTTLPA